MKLNKQKIIPKKSKIVKCPICNSTKFIFFDNNQCFGYVTNILRCKNCDFMFLEEQLTDTGLFHFYKCYYRKEKKENFTKIKFYADRERAISQFKFYEKYLELNSTVLEIGSGWGVNANFLFDKGFNIVIDEWDFNTNKILNKNIS